MSSSGQSVVLWERDRGGLGALLLDRSPAEPIPSAPDGLDDIWTQFLAEVADVHLDHVGPRVVVVAPDLIDELGLGQNLARMVHQSLEEGELP